MLDSTIVDRYKPNDDGTSDPKSRFCVTGWQDPHVLEIERAASTPPFQALYVSMQHSATRRWHCRIRDFKKAFRQSKNTSRRHKLAVRLPRDGRDELAHVLGIHPEQLLLCETEAYGLGSRRAWWRASAIEEFISLSYKVDPYEACVLSLFLPMQEKSSGTVVIAVDDLFEAGDEHHLDRMAQLESKYTFGKCVDLMECKDGSMYAGRKFKQLPDYSFEVDMHHFGATRLKEVILEPRKLAKNTHTEPVKYTRVDHNALTFKTVPDNGPDWKTCIRRRTTDIGTNQVLEDIKLHPGLPYEHIHRELPKFTKLKTEMWHVPPAKSKGEMVPNAGEQTQLRGAIGGISWMAREVRVDACASASILPQPFKDGAPTVSDAKEANQIIKYLKEILCLFKSMPSQKKICVK